jgi:hypothetical protein
MPVLPLPPENTRRYFLHYSAGALGHTFQIRSTEDISDADAVTNITNAFLNLTPTMYADVVFDSLERADKGSNVRNPVAGWATLVGGSIDNVPAIEKAYTVSFRGRTQGGHKIKNLLFGFPLTREADWQANPGEATGLATFIGILNSSARLFIGIDGLKPVWKSDVLQDYNDYWEHQLRP